MPFVRVTDVSDVTSSVNIAHIVWAQDEGETTFIRLSNGAEIYTPRKFMDFVKDIYDAEARART